MYSYTSEYPDGHNMKTMHPFADYKSVVEVIKNELAKLYRRKIEYTHNRMTGFVCFKAKIWSYLTNDGKSRSMVRGIIKVMTVR